MSCTKQTTYVAIWVGLDGFNDNTVEQTGIMAECENGKSVYSAWYEFYPNPSVTFDNIKVVPGDKIVAWVVYLLNKTFVTVLEEYNNNGLVFNRSSPATSVSDAERSSAEWIVERPSQCIGLSCNLTTLANFGNVSFGDYFSEINRDYVVLSNGTSLPFGYLSKYLYNITMVNNNGGSPLAYVSWFNDISSFNVIYVTTASKQVTHGHK
ncbi:G1 family glutamic endopeptidase [Caldisphaera sp.]|uniref:G1 family glutamic endopeptidase n=1 Tax=Caldisphaera sp. TaxID=2060322 RepID=UPI003D0A1FCF